MTNQDKKMTRNNKNIAHKGERCRHRLDTHNINQKSGNSRLECHSKTRYYSIWKQIGNHNKRYNQSHT
jgi:hypothetical protein